MVISKNKQVIIYSSSVAQARMVYASGQLEELNIVGFCTDEFVLDSSIIDDIAVVQFSEIADKADSVVIVADDDINKDIKEYFDCHNIEYSMLSDVVVDDSDDENEQICESSDIKIEESEINLVECEGCSDDSECETDDKIFNDHDDSVSERQESSVESAEFEEDQMEAGEREIVYDETAEESDCSTARTYFTDEQAREIQQTIVSHLAKTVQTVNLIKIKEQSIYNMNKELQKYKDDYFVRMTSPMISDLIPLREDFKKSLVDIEKYDMNTQKQIGYLECTVEQMESILVNYDVIIDQDKYFYNGKCIYPAIPEFITADNVSCSEIGIGDINENACFDFGFDIEKIDSLESLSGFLREWEQWLEAKMSDNLELNKTIDIQNEVLKKQMQTTDGILVIPILRKIIRLKLAFENSILQIQNFPEQSSTIYNEVYGFGVDCTEKIMLSLGVSVRSNIDDKYEPKYHRILKMQKISPDEAEKDKKIASFSTDCYVSGDRVIAPAKVIVYRL